MSVCSEEIWPIFGEGDPSEVDRKSLDDFFSGELGDDPTTICNFSYRLLDGFGLSRVDDVKDSVTVVVPDPKGNTAKCSDQAKDTAEKESYEIFCGRIQNEVPENVMVDRKDALKAVESVNGFEVRQGKRYAVSPENSNARLFVGNIPKKKGKEELYLEFNKRTCGLKDVIIYNNPDDRKINRGFCILEYGSHGEAYHAWKDLNFPPIKIWGCDILADWADPEEEPEEGIMKNLRVLYARNIPYSVTEADLKAAFAEHGTIDRVKKIKHFGFIHFRERHEAEAAKAAMNGQELFGRSVEVTWAKPPPEKYKTQQILRAREQRMFKLLSSRPARTFENVAVTQMGMFPFGHSQGMRPSQGHGSGYNATGSLWAYDMSHGRTGFLPFYSGPFFAAAGATNPFMAAQCTPRVPTLEAAARQQEIWPGTHSLRSAAQDRIGWKEEGNGGLGASQRSHQQGARGADRNRHPTVNITGRNSPSTEDSNWRARP